MNTLSAAARIGRLWRTARWLRPEQVLGRLRLGLPLPRPDLRPAPPLRAVAGAWQPPAAREPSLVGATRWRLLAEEHALAEIGWDDPAVPLLWRYNQHYFDDLNALGAADRRAWHVALVQRWCDECPPGAGTAWAPFPTSLRIVNWLKWHLGGAPLEQAWLDSLAVQVRWLSRRIEWHLLGNHLFANAKALVFAGLVFDGPEAGRWLAQGRAILAREMPEQFLADGAQFERSPMYHALALEDLLDLLNVLRARAPADDLAGALQARSGAALYWLRCMRHPDGTLARFNDCAEGIAPGGDEIEHYAARLGVHAARPADEGTEWLRASGYARVARGRAVALLDLAPVGPDYLPGHAHADTLSFELSLGGGQLIVNRGTSVYGTGARRQSERGTAAHSTLQIGAHDSSEVWAGFRVGRRARPQAMPDGEWAIVASHDGYGHLPGHPVHHRRWRFEAASLQIEDRVEPPAAEPAQVRFHLAPGLTLQGADRRWIVRDAVGNRVAEAEVLAGQAGVESWLHAVRFGVLAPAQTLLVTTDRQSVVRWTW